MPPSSVPGPSTLVVREIDATADARWDAYLATRDDAVVYQHSSWLRVLQREYGQPVIALAAEDAERAVRGVFPLMRTRGLPIAGGVGAPRLSSLPRTAVAGPLADDATALRALVAAAVDRAAGVQLQVKSPSAQLDGIVDGVVGHPWRESWTIDLPPDAAAVRFGNSRNHGRIRWAVNKAAKAGVRTRDAETLADIRRWYRLYLETMRHHAVPPRPLRLFVAMWDEMRPRGLMRLQLAERGGEVLAGSVLLSFGSTVFYAFNGVSRAGLGLRPNDVLQWEAIHAAAAAGHRHYDLGEVVEHHEGLAEFKRKWGSRPVRLRRHYHPSPAEPPNPGDGERGGAALLAERAWRRLPLRATAVIGDGVYRYL